MVPLIWLITGSSSGFGEQFVQSVIARGDRVVASGRNASSKLQHLKGTGAHILDLDVTASQAELNEKVAEALQVYGGIDILVNNAGYVESGFMEELTPERLQNNFNTNFFGAVNLTRAILPHFRSRQSGTLLFVGSQSGWQGEACTSSYCSTKFALEGMVESMNKELSGFGIKCIIFELGFYRTQVFSDRNFRFNTPNIPAYAEFNKMVKAFIQATHNNQPGDAKKAVERMIDVVKGEGMAEEKGGEFPLRMPLGTDGLAAVREKCLATLKICEEWEKIITSTDVDNLGEVPEQKF